MTDTDILHTTAQPGDLVQLVSPSNKVFLFRLTPGGELQTHRGVINFDKLIGLPWGSQVYSHTGSTFFMLQPGLGDLLKETRRNTQIMYPKDIGFILVTMGIGPGTHVIEAGTGSGAFTTALAWAVGPQGKVTTYEVRPEMQNLARKNLDRLGLADRVDFNRAASADDLAETTAKPLSLVFPNPYDNYPKFPQALNLGASFVCVDPTTT